MEVKKGYKQTEVGEIPEDWEVKKLGDIAEVSSGGTPDRKNPIYWNGDIPWITTSQIDFNKIDQAEEFITNLGFINSSTKKFYANTLLMAMYGQGKTRGKIAILEIEATINQACAAIQLKKSVSIKYTFYNLAKRYDEIRSLSNIGNQENLNGNIIKSIQIPLPPLPEQHAIAAALSDVDAMLTSLGQLITKKRNIKQGAMQELLTGKKRLVGFMGEWKLKSINEFVYDFRGGAPLTPDDFKADGVKVLPKGGVIRGGVLVIEKEDLQYCSNKYADNHKTNLVDNSFTIVVLRDLVPSGPAIGLMVKIRSNDNFILAQGVYGFKVKKEIVNASFLIQLSNTKEYRKLMNSIMVGSTQIHITNTAFLNLQIELPPTVEEQEAIAAILTDMDAEIEKLEQQRDKYKAIKQGMMQELLTGKTRLI